MPVLSSPRVGPGATWSSTWARPATAFPWWIAPWAVAAGAGGARPAEAAPGRAVADGRDPHGPHRFHRRGDPRRGAPDGGSPCGGGGSPSPPTSWARPSSASMRPEALPGHVPRRHPGPRRARLAAPARDRADRPRRPRADPPGQPLAQAHEPHPPLRRAVRRGDPEARRRAAPADPPRGGATSARTSTVDMEQYAHKDLTPGHLPLGGSRSPSSATGPNVGIVLQAYLTDTEADLHALLDWGARAGARRSRSAWSRGAYWGLRGHPGPAGSAGPSRSGSTSGGPTPCYEALCAVS